MLEFLRGLPVCHAQGGKEKGCAHRAEARFLACTFVHFTRSPFTQRSRRRVLGKAYQISQEPPYPLTKRATLTSIRQGIRYILWRCMDIRRAEYRARQPLDGSVPTLSLRLLAGFACYVTTPRLFLIHLGPFGRWVACFARSSAYSRVAMNLR